MQYADRKKALIRHCPSWNVALGLLLGAVLLCVSGMHAQVLYGTITGQVTDPTGASIPNATITVTNQANGETRSGGHRGWW
jgi:hypothetical protein